MGDTNIYTVDENGNAAMRITTQAATVTDPTSIYGTDENGDAAVRVIGVSSGDPHNMGWFATPEALKTALPTAENGDFAIVGSTDTVWVWDSDTTDWKNTGIQPTNNYSDLTNKPQINGITLSGNKTADDLGIKGSVQISVTGTTTVEGFSVPNPTDEEVTAIYNAVVAGNSVHVVDTNDVYYQVLQADSVDGAINIELLYFGELSLLYTLENDTVTVTGKKIGGGSSYTAGTGIDITGGVISVTDPVVVDTSESTSSFTIGTSRVTSGGYGVAVGYESDFSGTNCTAVGAAAYAGDWATSIGQGSRAEGGTSLCIGYWARTTASRAIQLGQGTNNEKNTFCVGLSLLNNYKLLDSDGTIPAARHASLPTADGTYVLKLTITSGVPTLSWVAE